MEKNQEIIKKAKNTGFDLVGVTTAAPLNQAYNILKKRKKKNLLPKFMNNNIKLVTHPRRIMPEASSIIAVGVSYATEISFTEDAFISRYARGSDYHHFMKNKLKKLSNFIKSLTPGVKTKIISDNGPLLEREIAVRAGLGWIGKNTNLINPEFGSYLFLGEILTNLKLKPTPVSFENYCKNCNICLKKCQGQALSVKNPYYLDEEKCISFLTQKKGILPYKQRDLINGNLWGCDYCQQVCPFNQNIPLNLHPDFTPNIKGNLKTVLNFNKNNIPQSWKNSALSWRGIRILKRNALIVIKNKNYLKYIPLVKQELDNNSPIIRAYAIWTLFNIDSNFNKKDLKKIVHNENDEMVLSEINKLLK